MTVLVTGSSGHLGEAIVRTLRRNGGEGFGLDIKPGPFTDHVGSITDRDFVRQSLKDAQAIVHSATLHKPHVATHSQQEFIDTNITGTLVLLEEAIRARVQTFIFTSIFSPARQAPLDRRLPQRKMRLPLGSPKRCNRCLRTSTA